MRAAKHWIFFIFVIISGLLCPGRHAFAQGGNRYFEANQLFDQQEFEQAFPLFSQLMQENPGTYLFFERATQCLINLEQYDRALEFTDTTLNRSGYDGKAKIRLGEIYHIKNDTETAYRIWDEVIANSPDALEIYIALAETMRERRDFKQAIVLYQKAQRRFPSVELLITGLADTYMQAGEYEKAIRSYLSILKKSPDKINYVQAKLFRLRDDRLYDAAILEIDDFLGELPDTHYSKNILQQLELWLLLERGLAERALATATRYEDKADQPAYLLFSLASRLLAAEQFELAAQAYSYYLDSENRSLRFQSMEQLAQVYIQWADYLSDYNLAFANPREELYQKADDTLQSLVKQSPQYAHLSRVLVTRAELSLDYMHNPEQAGVFAVQLQSINDSSYTTQRMYMQGRILLYAGDYGRARISFSKSNKQERLGPLAEKTRYYLALTDFYAGDYEFADIQLNALERQNTSYFANDALQLRVWIQQGLQADSTGQLLKPFAGAIEKYRQGDLQTGFSSLMQLVDSSAFAPLKDEALLVMSTHITPHSIQPLYQKLDEYLENPRADSPLHERLLWERARMADQWLTYQPADDILQQKSMPATVAGIIPLYEAILLNYPQGFYASNTRERIRELQQKKS